MIRAFLSHSSADKNRYVRIVAQKLGENNCVYDEYTFEFGMQPLEEIVRGLEASQLFVVFLSEKALESDWVQKEILLAHEKLSIKELIRIFPIIIDSNLTYQYTRIPQWMRDEYNLKYVSRPTVAARRIRQRLREISWMYNPRLKERESIFVGRNELIKIIEERIDDFSQELPKCFISSGLPRIGRSALLRHALVKSNVTKDSYEFPLLIMRREESLEDLILKLYDLGLSHIPYPVNLMSIDINRRISIAVSLAKDIIKAKETILIRDEGCIINFSRRIQPWFDNILTQLSTSSQPIFLLCSRYRPLPEELRSRPFIFGVSVPELSFNERGGLFKRFVDFEGLALTRDDFVFFCNHFQGFPDQIRFACDLIHDLGVADAKKGSYQIIEFNSDRASVILGKYSAQPKYLDFLYLLSEFEFISLDFLFSIVDESEFGELVNDLIAASICDYVGIEKEFIRLNDAIRDYVRRNQISLPDVYQKKLKQHLDIFLKTSDEEERDVSDITYSIKEAIKAGKTVPEQYLIPSHFLRSIRDIYQKRGNLDRVIELADKLLEKEHLLDKTVAQDIRYFLCLALARKRDTRMLEEVQKIHGIEHNFLLGFYYRRQGRAGDAMERLTRCLGEPIVAKRAKREIVQVYLSIEDYESASTLAQSNYEENRNNPYHIQAYFNTIINSEKAKREADLLLRLIRELEAISSDLAKEMAMIALAEFAVKCEDNYQKALDIIDDAIHTFPDSYYTLISKAFIAARNRDVRNLESSYEKLEKLARRKNISEDSLVRLKCYLLTLQGDLGKALNFAEMKLTRYPDYSRRAFMQKLKEISSV
ncbi:MAG: toll/interleukin-1 receptor domain-containing protein [Deltaproteobacteria bacterium]|nr:MAG: toll/interleukin-1 receptor domain-containing protein [Deltaproteobacteria bacterium]